MNINFRHYAAPGLWAEGETQQERGAASAVPGPAADTVEEDVLADIVEICDDPATAFKQKKDSSLTVGLNVLLRDGQADGFISAGSTGTLLAGATLVVTLLSASAGFAARARTDHPDHDRQGRSDRLRCERRMHERVPAAIRLLRQLLCRKGARHRATARRTFEYRCRAEQGRHPPP